MITVIDFLDYLNRKYYEIIKDNKLMMSEDYFVARTSPKVTEILEKVTTINSNIQSGILSRICDVYANVIASAEGYSEGFYKRHNIDLDSYEKFTSSIKKWLVEEEKKRK